MKAAGAIILLFALIYGFQAWAVLGNQDELLFQGAELSEQSKETANQQDNTEEIHFETSDGEILHGWLHHAEDAEDDVPLVIYFGGNGEEASQAMESHQLPQSWASLYMNYRSYGNSTGSPSEENLAQDGRELFEYMANRDEVNESSIVAMGRSMGTGVAAHVSYAKDTAATILVSPYDSRTELQKERHPFLPHGTFIQHPFEVSTMAQSIETPLLGITAAEDEVIPPDHSKVTLNEWSGPVTHVHIAEHHHNNINQAPEFDETVSDFLNDLQN